MIDEHFAGERIRSVEPRCIETSGSATILALAIAGCWLLATSSHGSWGTDAMRSSPTV